MRHLEYLRLSQEKAAIDISKIEAATADDEVLMAVKRNVETGRWEIDVKTKKFEPFKSELECLCCEEPN